RFGKKFTSTILPYTYNGSTVAPTPSGIVSFEIEWLP
ncbi:MAG: hypothetical protein ACJAZR_000237, partial [Sediminicola sp.]